MRGCTASGGEAVECQALSVPISFQSATFFSGMLHSRTLPSSEPLRKKRSFCGGVGSMYTWYMHML